MYPGLSRCYRILDFSFWINVDVHAFSTSCHKSHDNIEYNTLVSRPLVSSLAVNIASLVDLPGMLLQCIGMSA